MSVQPKSLMTQYAEGALISRELHDMMHQYAADARFEIELSGHEENLTSRMYADKPYGRHRVLIHKGNPDEQ